MKRWLLVWVVLVVTLAGAGCSTKRNCAAARKAAGAAWADIVNKEQLDIDEAQRQPEREPVYVQTIVGGPGRANHYVRIGSEQQNRTAILVARWALDRARAYQRLARSPDTREIERRANSALAELRRGSPAWSPQLEVAYVRLLAIPKACR